MANRNTLDNYLNANAKEIAQVKEDDNYLYFLTNNMHHIMMLHALGYHLSYQELKDGYYVRVKKENLN